MDENKVNTDRILGLPVGDPIHAGLEKSQARLAMLLTYLDGQDYNLLNLKPGSIIHVK